MRGKKPRALTKGELKVGYLCEREVGSGYCNNYAKVRVGEGPYFCNRHARPVRARRGGRRSKP